jgi:hypothetical protein
MNASATIEVLGPYASLEDAARLHYGRLLWRRPATRDRLLRHWTDPRHPWAERFTERYRPFVDHVLKAGAEDDHVTDAWLRGCGHSLRTIAREIPPVFGSFY